MFVSWVTFRVIFSYFLFNIQVEIPNEDKPMTSRRICILAICSLGLTIGFVLMSFMEERIMVTEYKRYDANGTLINFRLEDTQYVMLGNRIVGGIFGMVAMTTFHKCSKTKHVSVLKAPGYTYSIASLIILLSNWSLLEALRYIEYPTQVVAKAFHVVPVMLVGKLMASKKYHFMEYFIIGVITKETCLFFYEYAQNNASSTIVSDYSPIDGYTLLLFYLAIDAFGQNWHGRIFR